MRKIAFGPLALKPWEFRALSWPEFWEMYSGWQARREWEFEHTRFLAWTISATSWNPIKAWKKPANVMQLKELDAPAKVVTAEEEEAFLQRMIQKTGLNLVPVKTAEA